MNSRRAMPGQRFHPSAGQWNRFLDAADAIEASRRLGASPPILSPRPDVDFAVLNGSGALLDRFSVVAVSAWAISPTANEDEALWDPTLTVVAPTASTGGDVAILLEPIAAGTIGRARFAGVVACLVDVTVDGIKRATSISGDATKLRTSPDGAIEIVVRQSGSDGVKWALVRFGGSAAATAGRPGHRITAATPVIAGATPQWRYTLQPLAGFASGTWSSSGTSVIAYNLAEDQAAYQHGQPLTTANGATLVPSAVEGPVPAWFSGLYESGSPVWHFDAQNPMDVACGTAVIDGGTWS